MIYQGNIDHCEIQYKSTIFYIFLFKPNISNLVWVALHYNEALCINPFKIQLTESLGKVVKYSIIAATCFPLQSTMSVWAERGSQSLSQLKHSTQSDYSLQQING